jgi:hypothetical protein
MDQIIGIGSRAYSQSVRMDITETEYAAATKDSLDTQCLSAMV